MIVKILDDLTNILKSWPGISQKTAQKLTYFLINQDKNHIQHLLQTIQAVTENIKVCQTCFALTFQQQCLICQDKSRQKVLMIVESPLDILKFEQLGTFKGYYHVIGSLTDIDESEAINLNMISLKSRTQEFNEIIIALSPTLKGIVAVNYLKSWLNHRNISQLANGLPIGSNLEYIDELTLKIALEKRLGVK